MRKIGITLISLLLSLSIAASGIGYYYSINKTNDNKEENNNITDKTEEIIDSELEEYFNKIGKKYDNIYTMENIELKDFTFDKETEKLFMDNFIIKNLEDYSFGDYFESEKVPNQDLMKNWLFVYIVGNKNINEACFSQTLLLFARDNIFGNRSQSISLYDIFNDNEITTNYVCYSKKNSDIKEYKYKEVKTINYDDEDVISYYEIKDSKDEIHYISFDISNTYDDNNNYISDIYSYNIYEEKTQLENIIKDREFDKKGNIHVGASVGSLYHGEVEYLKENGSFEIETEKPVNIILNNGKLIFKEENKQVTVPVENIKEVVINGKDVQQLDYEIYFFNDMGELYYYDDIPYEYIAEDESITLEDEVKKYKKILTLDKKIKNFVFRVNDSDEYDIVLEILLKLEDNTLYSINNNKVADYLVSLLNNVKIYENKDVEINNKIVDNKFKSLIDIESFTNSGYIDYFITKEDYLYDIDKNRLVTNNKIDKIYKQNGNNCAYNYLITFKNKESIGIGDYRCG